MDFRQNLTTRPRHSPGTVQALRRGLRVLDVLASRGGRLVLTEIARLLKMHPSTTHHLVKTLQAAGYLAQDARTREYRLAAHVFELAAVAWNEDSLAALAAPLVTGLAMKTEETAHLAVLDWRAVVVIRKVDAEGPWRFSERVGTQRPVHCTALGKSLLAFQGDDVTSTSLRGIQLRAFTPRTIVTLAGLRAELRRTRARGYAVDDEEYAPGLRCVAAPVFNFSGILTAALGISGPSFRIPPARVPELAATVREFAERLSRELGFLLPYTPPQGSARTRKDPR
jgi:IclR family acetate operon transcriptional repressor